MNVNIDDIECDESIVVFNISKEVDSINFKNAIIQLQLPFELPEFEKDIEEMIIDFGDDYYGNLIIKNYPNLQKIIVKHHSLMNLKSLKICNCDELKTIEIEASAFWDVKNVIIESSALFGLISLYFPNLQSFITNYNTFFKIADLSLLSNYHLIDLIIISSLFTTIQSYNKFLFIAYYYYYSNHQ